MFKNLYLIITFVSVFVGLAITFFTLPNFHISNDSVDGFYLNQKVASHSPFGPSITTYKENYDGPECENTAVFEFNGGWPIADQQEVVSCSPTYVNTFVWPIILNFLIFALPTYLVLFLIVKSLRS